MALIERTISITFQHRVFFTRNVFGLGNPLLKDVLAGHFGSPSPRDKGAGRGDMPIKNVPPPPAPLLHPMEERGQAPPKVLVVLDESLHDAQPALVPQLETYFKPIADCAQLVCPPFVLEGGERVK